MYSDLTWQEKKEFCKRHNISLKPDIVTLAWNDVLHPEELQASDLDVYIIPLTELEEWFLLRKISRIKEELGI